MQSELTEEYECLLASWQSAEPLSTRLLHATSAATLWNYKGGEPKAGSARCAAVLDRRHVLLPSSSKPILNAVSLNNVSPSHTRSVLPGVVNALAVHPSGRFVFAAIKEVIYTWQACTGDLLSKVPGHYQPVAALRCTSDGSALVSAGHDGALTVWPTNELSSRPSVDVAKSAASSMHWQAHSLPILDLHVAVAPAARLYTASADRSVKVYSTRTSAQLGCVIFDCVPRCIAVNPGETELYVGTDTALVLVVSLLALSSAARHELHASTLGDGSSGTHLMRGHKSALCALAVNADSSLLASGDHDGQLRIWMLATRQCLRTAHPCAGPLATLQFVWRPDDLQTAIRPLPVFNKKLSKAGLTQSVIEAPPPARLQKDMQQTYDRLWESSVRHQQQQSVSAAAPATNGNASAVTTVDNTAELRRARTVNKELYEFCLRHVLQPNKDVSAMENGEDDDIQVLGD